jgi:hypothetical protein
VSDFEHMFLYYTAATTFALASAKSCEREDFFTGIAAFLISVGSLVMALVWLTRLVF